MKVKARLQQSFSKESKLGYKFYLASDKEFVYRSDWAEHNYNLFMKYHTLDNT